MQFVVDGNQVDCVRMQWDEHRKRARHQIVVSFDAHLNIVAPHVAASLKADECAQLEAWLRDRRRLRAKKVPHALLDSLPELLLQAESAVRKEEALSEELVERLRESIVHFSNALHHVKVTPDEASPPIEQMTGSEVLKEQMAIVHEDLP